jgi:hypothetical protein
MFSWLTGWHIVLAFVLGIVALGGALTCTVFLMRGVLWLAGLSHLALSWLWHRLTGTNLATTDSVG